MLLGQSHTDPSSFDLSVYSQAQRPDSHTLYTLFPIFEYLLFTILHPAMIGLQLEHLVLLQRKPDC